MGTGAEVDLEFVTCEGNAADQGGAVWVAAGGDFGARSTGLLSNVATGDGGALYTVGAAALACSLCVVAQNQAADGGGLFVDGAVAFSTADGELRDNVAAGDGGGAYVANTTWAAAGTDLLANRAARGGGLASSSATVNLAASVLDANTATGAGGGAWVDGGGWSVSGITAQDQLADRGGAFAVEGGASLTVVGGSFLGHLGTTGGSVLDLVDGTVAWIVVDLGAPSGPDNGVPEITTPAGAQSYDGATSTTCTAAGCSP